MSSTDNDSDSMEFFEINKSDVSHERLDGEVIVISLAEGLYYSFSGSAADVWWLIQEGYSPDGMVEVLSEVFELPSNDVHELGIDKFIKQALDRGLISSVEQRNVSPKPIPHDYARGIWIPPSFTEFTDLKDLILVDPIHDTTTLGWPMIRDE